MILKQEQREAETLVKQVAPGVLRMQLPIALPGLRHVNMYCLPDARGATVIDPGLPEADSWTAVQARLREADLEVRHIHTVIVTHSHPDHFGGAARFHAASGARVIAHEDFSLRGERLHLAHTEVSVEDWGEPRAVNREGSAASALDLSDFQLPWGNDLSQQNDRDRMEWERIREFAPKVFVPPITHVVRHGGHVELGGRSFTVVHSPGHTADHICLYDRESGTLFAGDHVLPSITPHISGLNDIQDPLQSFYESLDRVVELGAVQRCLPAHGDSFDDVSGRVSAIKQHHEQRLQKLLEITKRLGPATVREISHSLFSERSWGIMAESETYAHLEHLRLRRQAERQKRADGALLYVA